ncbi:MAG: hypothetical protein SCALA702_18960 [Melioribacteraceae bacterium]|nr:MAG: hypothetical protein SCALA702_18960 [Melioribacteraceae bacterium]
MHSKLNKSIAVFFRNGVLVSVLLLMFCGSLIGQDIYFDSGLEGVENTSFILKGQIYTEFPLKEVIVAYKSTGENEYKFSESIVTANNFLFEFPAEDVTAPEVEFYIQYYDTRGNTGYYPEDFSNVEVPSKIVVSPKPDFYDDVILLNPISETAELNDEFFITWSTFKLPDNVNNTGTKVIINGEDVTGKCLINDDLITFIHSANPGILSPGANSINLEFYDKSGNLLFKKISSIGLRPDSEIPLAKNQFYYRGNLLAEGRNELYNSNHTWYNNVSGEFNGKYGSFGFETRFYLTSEEKSYRQPQNRFFAAIRSEYFTISAGDHFPVYPSLIYSGKRLRGVTGRVELGFFELSASYGQINRSVEGRVLETFTGNNTPLDPNIIELDPAIYGVNFARIQPGGYSRDLMVVRPVFNFTNTSSLGFTYLHSKDDPGSIVFGSQPKENVVFGPDLRLSFDNSRIKLKSSAFLSLQNNDISEGTIADSLVENFLEENEYIDIIADDFNRYKDILGTFITVNQYIGPLNITEFASLASDVELQLDYFGNTLRTSYIYRGNEYNSFGKPFVRKDVAGFSVFDRLRLLNNKLFFNFNFENLNDNLQKTKFNTTNIKNLNVSVSWFPRNELPDITAGYKFTQNKNDVNPLDTSRVALLIDDFTDRYFVQSAYTFYTPVRQSVALRLSYAGRDDKTFRDFDTKVINGGVSVSSRWSEVFQTYLGVSVNKSESALSELNYTRISLSGRWLLFEGKLLVSGKISPTLGDLKRTGLEVYGDYYFTEQFTLSYQLRYFTDFDLLNSSIAGVTVKYSI